MSVGKDDGIVECWDGVGDYFVGDFLEGRDEFIEDGVDVKENDGYCDVEFEFLSN